MQINDSENVDPKKKQILTPVSEVRPQNMVDKPLSEHSGKKFIRDVPPLNEGRRGSKSLFD